MATKSVTGTAGTYDSASNVTQTWTETTTAGQNTYNIQDLADEVRLTLRGASGDVINIEAASGEFEVKAKGKVVTFKSDNQTIIITLNNAGTKASAQAVKLNFLDGSIDLVKAANVNGLKLGGVALSNKPGKYITGTVAENNIALDVFDDSSDSQPTYAVTAAASVDEGSTVNFTLSTTGVAPGETFSYVLSGVSEEDVLGGSLTGVATVDSLGKAVIPVTLVADNTTEIAAETLTISIAGTTKSVTVNDTSKESNQGKTFTLTDSTLGTAPAALKVMNLAGDQDVRIDMTNKNNQITGLDLNGNGSIANDGKENALDVKPATGYAAVDAYTRLDNGVVNETNLAKVFLGDIKYDGSGFAGDGKTTNGNVVLGGLGADTILGGIGNDFLAAGGIAVSHAAATESLLGGRNADFMFAELSLLSNTDGNKLFIDGGATADDTSAANGQSTQDSDWLLLQASDDDERIEVRLTENVGPVGTTSTNDGTLTTRANQYATLRDIENLDASGNTYGFIKGLTPIGGAPVNANNNGIGSSGQLNVTGSEANNIIIGGYDNDAINGGAGNDTLLGGNMKSYGAGYLVSQGTSNVATQQLLDPNLVGLTGNNDGRDELTGGTGNDNIVFEADGGIIEGGLISNDDDIGFDTLWLTANSMGAVAADGSVTPVDTADTSKVANDAINYNSSGANTIDLDNLIP